MDIESIKNAVMAPITEENPVGELLTSHELYVFIEEQMMKVGSLSHGTVQWQKVEDSLIKLLSEKSKDLKLLTHLLQCLHQRDTKQSFLLAIVLFTDFITLYWDSSHPMPGARGAVLRKRYFSQINQRISLALHKLDFNSYNNDDRQNLASAIHSWKESVISKELLSDTVEEIVTAIKSRLDKSEKREKVEAETKVSANTDITKEELLPVKEVVKLDSSSTKAIKQSLFKMAEYLSEQDLGVELAMRVRRYAVWSTITSLPEHNKDGETLLRMMTLERIKEYEDQFKNPDWSLWSKVEKSLEIAPYWFDGHFLSYQIVEKLGNNKLAEAILYEAQSFIQRLPKLDTLTFKCGTPFISKECKEWLSNDGIQNSINGNVSDNWESKKKEAIILAKKSGVGAALTMVNDEINRTKEPREHYYWYLISAEIMQKNNLKSIALQQYQQLNKQIKSMSVSEWEPSLVSRLTAYTKS